MKQNAAILNVYVTSVEMQLTLFVYADLEFFIRLYFTCNMHIDYISYIYNTGIETYPHPHAHTPTHAEHARVHSIQRIFN